MRKEMSEADPIEWMAGEFTSGLANVLELMGEVRPETSWQKAQAPPASEALLWREQSLNLLPQPCIWVAAPSNTWLEVGSRTLRAAGVDPVEEADARDTYLEILSQALSGLAQALASRLGGEVTCGKSSEPASPPAVSEGLAVALTYEGTSLPALFVAFSPELVARVTEEPAAETPPQAEKPPASTQSREPAAVAPFTAGPPQSIEMLLDLDLPVTVSFGQSRMLLSDVLKLNTGSVIELSSHVNDPVEVIVNNCVVATGEVVVVNGNFGIRIEHILAPEERLRFSVPQSSSGSRATIQGAQTDRGGPLKR